MEEIYCKASEECIECPYSYFVGKIEIKPETLEESLFETSVVCDYKTFKISPDRIGERI